MFRNKPKDLHPVKDLDQANRALAEIAAVKRSIAEAVNECNAEIDLLKIKAEERVEPLKLRLLALEKGLEAYAQREKDELFTQRRSRELVFGLFGWRKSSEIKPKPKGSWKQVLGLIKEFGFAEALRIKEEVNRDELSQWTAERLELVGARRVEKDTFWYEINEQALAETAN